MSAEAKPRLLPVAELNHSNEPWQVCVSDSALVNTDLQDIPTGFTIHQSLQELAEGQSQIDNLYLSQPSFTDLLELATLAKTQLRNCRRVVVALSSLTKTRSIEALALALRADFALTATHFVAEGGVYAHFVNRDGSVATRLEEDELEAHRWLELTKLLTALREITELRVLNSVLSGDDGLGEITVPREQFVELQYKFVALMNKHRRLRQSKAVRVQRKVRSLMSKVNSLRAKIRR